MREPSPATNDTVEIADVVRTLQRQWRAVIGFTLVGILGALAIILFAPRRFDGKATVLVRTSNQGGGSILSRITGANDLLGGMGGLGAATGIETELQVLRSGALAGAVVDSLRMQVAVREPEGTPVSGILDSYALASSFAPRKLTFERQSNGSYSIEGLKSMATPGHPADIGVGTLTLTRSGNLPESFTLLVLDRQDAIARLNRRSKTTKAGGEIASITYRGDDSISAAAVPNAIVSLYLDRRKTVDRGANQKRVEYVTEQLDHASRELATAESELRRFQERTRVYDADVADKATVESAAHLRESLISLQIDEGGLKQLLALADQGSLTSRDLAAYPSFIRGSAVSPFVQQLSELEVQRTKLLERRTERDPEVQAIDRSIQYVNAAIASMARSYASSITKQRVLFEARLDSVQRDLQALPAAGERVGRLKRDVIRMTEIYTALQAQLIEARLAAIGEGGDVRQIDLAAVPRSAAFPQPIMTMGIGIAGGFLAGIVAALFLGLFGRWLRDPMDVERLTGISAQRLSASAPLLVSGAAAQRTLLVVPLDNRAQSQAVAERLARTAAARSTQVTLLDLSSPNGNGAHAGDLDVATRIDQLEQQHGTVVVQLPDLGSDTAVAAMNENRPVILVAPPGPVNRERLTIAVDTLRRMNVPCAGIVISDDTERSRFRVLR